MVSRLPKQPRRDVLAQAVARWLSGSVAQWHSTRGMQGHRTSAMEAIVRPKSLDFPQNVGEQQD